jgi:hypothetical protein
MSRYLRQNNSESDISGLIENILTELLVAMGLLIADIEVVCTRTQTELRPQSVLGIDGD